MPGLCPGECSRRISAAPNTVREYTGELPTKIATVINMAQEWSDEIVAIGVRHKVVVDAFATAIREAMPDRKLFVVTGATMSLAKRRALRKTLRKSKNGILLCTQQSLPSSVNFEYVNKVIIPELHYNNSRMSQFYMRFVRFNSEHWKDIYFVTHAGSIESNLMQISQIHAVYRTRMRFQGMYIVAWGIVEWRQTDPPQSPGLGRTGC